MSTATATEVEVISHAMTVNGETVPTTSTFDVINPSTGAAFAAAPHAREDQVDAAVAAAKAAFPSWALTPMQERQAAMMKAHDICAAHKDELAALLVKE